MYQPTAAREISTIHLMLSSQRSPPYVARRHQCFEVRLLFFQQVVCIRLQKGMTSLRSTVDSAFSHVLALQLHVSESLMHLCNLACIEPRCHSHHPKSARCGLVCLVGALTCITHTPEADLRAFTESRAAKTPGPSYSRTAGNSWAVNREHELFLQCKNILRL